MTLKLGGVSINTQPIAKEIRSVRKQKGWSQEKLAEKVGVSRTHITNIENCTYSPSVATLLKIVTALNMEQKFLGAMSQIMT